MSLLEGAIDTHVHSSPDLVDRAQTDLELAQAAVAADMAGVVVKHHVLPTVTRTALVNEAVDASVLSGGVVLNGPVGGLNLDAVEMALALGGRIVWLPTLWSAVDAERSRATGGTYKRGQRIPSATEQISVVSDGDVTDRVDDLIAMIGEHDAVLATGHIGFEETLAVAKRCHERDVRCLVNHPFARYLDTDIDGHERLAEHGATLEYCAITVENYADHDVGAVARAIERIGPDRCVLASDLGQVGRPPVAGLRAFAAAVVEAGIPEADVRTMLTTTPATVLGL